MYLQWLLTQVKKRFKYLTLDNLMMVLRSVGTLFTIASQSILPMKVEQS